KEVRRIAEEFADLHRKERQQRGEHRRFVEDAVLKLREGLAAEPSASLRQPPLDRRHRVPAEGVVVAQVAGYEQKPQFDVFGVVRHGATPHRGIQTRTSESNRSGSSGLAM